MPPFPASAVAAVRSASGTARRTARSVKRIGRGFYEQGGLGERACYGDGEAIARDLAAGRGFLVRGVRKRRPPAGGVRLRPRRKRAHLRAPARERGKARLLALDFPLSRDRR